MKLRDARAADLDALVELERACYPPDQAYSRDEYRYALTRAKAINLVGEEPSEARRKRAPERPPEGVARSGAVGPVGFVGAFHHSTQRVGHVYTVNVHPKERGRGLGRALMEACEDRLRALGMRRVILEVNVENAAAFRLYERMGYARVRLLEDYYTQYPVNDAWLCAKEL